jgi:hypothetical protein
VVLPLARAAAVSTGLRLPAVSVGVAPTGGLARGRLRTGRVPRKGVAPHTHLVGVGVRVRARARARARARVRVGVGVRVRVRVGVKVGVRVRGPRKG